MSEKTTSFYNRFAMLYPLVDVFLKPQKKALLGEINSLPEGRLLEIGVGNGSHLQLYKKHNITGIDTSPAMLQAAAKRNPGNVELLQMDGKALLLEDEQFDYIVLSHVIAVVDDTDQLLKEVARVLKPNGKIFILNHFTPGNWLGYIDRVFASIAPVFHFKSVFHIDEMTTIAKFTLLKEIRFGALSYFKLLIYQKK